MARRHFGRTKRFFVDDHIVFSTGSDVGEPTGVVVERTFDRRSERRDRAVTLASHVTDVFPYHRELSLS